MLDDRLNCSEFSLQVPKLVQEQEILFMKGDFEARIRKWRQLKFGFVDSTHLLPPRRSTSNDPKRGSSSSRTNGSLRPQLPTCSTSPLPRKNMAFAPLPFQPHQHQPQPNNEVNRRFDEVKRQSGQLRLGGQLVQCSFDELIHEGDIGHGSCGHVARMSYKGQVMAVKQMARTGNSETSKRILMDLDVVLKCRECPHIVLCYGFFILENQVYVCMEKMATCLDRFLKRTRAPVPEKYIGKMAVSILSALNYLKETHNIIHRDVKPSNILLDWDGNVKLCDFGIAGQLIESKVFTRSAGCPPYMAPERFAYTETGEPGAYDIRSDVWSVGITLVELARGEYPYHGMSEFEILTEILQSPPPQLSVEEGFSPEFCDFVRLCLIKDVIQRPKYAVLLNHPFIKRSREDQVDLADWFQDHMSEE